MKDILIVFGSMTPEHDLSCKSAATILEGIDREKFNPIAVGITKEGKWFYTEASIEEIKSAEGWLDSPTNKKCMLDTDFGSHRLIVFEDDNTVSFKNVDCVFARIAGNMGEDGKLQGLFEVAGIPYVGCGVMSSACSMDKDISYMFADSIGLRRPQTQVLWKKDFDEKGKGLVEDVKEDLAAKVGFPIFVKPTSTGSSVGISKAHDEDELWKALEIAFSYGDKVVLEENIVGTEIKVGILGNEDPKIGALCELTANGDFNDFDTKYIAHSSTKKIPAELDSETEKMIKDYTIKIYKALDCKGFSRIDHFLTEDGQLVFNEVNSMPGFQPTSVYPVLFDAIGMPYTELITELLELAMENK